MILGNAEGTKYRYARRAGEAQSYLLDRDPDFPAQRVAVARGEHRRRAQRSRAAGDDHARRRRDGDRVEGRADRAELRGRGACPTGRELSYPGVANVIGNALRELNLEDVEPAARREAERSRSKSEFKTFDGLVVRVTRQRARRREAWVSFVASVDPAQAARFAARLGDRAPRPNRRRAARSAAAATEPRRQPRTAGRRRPSRRGGAHQRARRRLALQDRGFQYDQMTRRMADL